MPVPPSPPLDETIVVGQTDHVHDHEVIADALNNDTMSLAGEQEVGGTKHFSTVTVKDKPWVDPCHPSFGCSLASADNSAAIAAACAAASANNVPVLFTPPDPADIHGYKVQQTIDLWPTPGLHIGGQPTGTALGGGGALIRISNITNGNPIFECDTDAHGNVPRAAYKFSNIFTSNGLPLRMVDVFESEIENCRFGVATLEFENCWGWKFSKSYFQSPGSTLPSVKFTGRPPGAAGHQDVCYLHDFKDCVFDTGGVKLYQQHAAGASYGWFSFRDSYTENMTVANGSMFEFESGVPTDLNNSLYNLRFDRCGMYDSIGGYAPLVRLQDGSGYMLGWAFFSCDNGGLGNNFIQVDATAHFPQFIGTILHGTLYPRIVGPDGTTDYAYQSGTFRPNSDPAVLLGNLEPTGVLLPERTDPSAPGVNLGVVYLRDNGAGKSQLCVRFNTGAIQVIATQP